MALLLEQTGLPLNVDADFWVTSDRRTLWDDMDPGSKVLSVTPCLFG